MTPVIFLDFDGVLNGNDWLATLPLTFSSVVDLDPACCARLQRILDATGAVVVISSSWREMLSTELICEELARNGITATVIGVTPIKAYRHEEIQAWLDAHPHVTNYCALDDVALPGHEDNRVRTDERTGLTDADVERAIAILGADK